MDRIRLFSSIVADVSEEIITAGAEQSYELFLQIAATRTNVLDN